MLKYYTKFFSNYQYSNVLQTLTLLAMLTFFVIVFIRVFKRPKEFYKDVANSPLELEPRKEDKNIRK